MRRTPVYLWIILLLPACLSAQRTTSELLASVHGDPGLRAWQDLAARYRASQATLPWLEEVQLRGRSRRFATMRHDVILRTSFNSPVERSAEKDKHLAQTDLTALKAEEVRQTLLKQRYMAILETIHLVRQHAFAHARLHHHQTLDTLYLLTLAAGQSADLSRFLRNKEEIIQARLTLERLAAQRDGQLAALHLSREDSIVTRDLVSPSTMRSLVEGTIPRFDRTLEALDHAASLRFLSAGKAAQSARDHRILDFLEARYTIRNDLFFEDRFTIGVGLTAPWRGSSRIKIQKLVLDQEEIKADLVVSQWHFQEAFDQERTRFRQQFAMLLAYEAAMSDSAMQALRETIAGSGRASAWELEQLRFAHHEVEARKWEHYYQLALSYIRLLDLSERLYEAPLRDYLHELLPLLGE